MAAEDARSCVGGVLDTLAGRQRVAAGLLIAEGIVSADRIVVLGHGSVCGVDLGRFQRDPAAFSAVRARLGIPENAVVALYLGRLSCEKGLPELADAFGVAARRCSGLRLLIVGPDEQCLRPSIEQTLAHAASRLHFVDQTTVPEEYMAASDFFVIPSYREGFGSTVIEAAACKIPAIGRVSTD